MCDLWVWDGGKYFVIAERLSRVYCPGQGLVRAHTLRVSGERAKVWVVQAVEDSSLL